MRRIAQVSLLLVAFASLILIIGFVRVDAGAGRPYQAAFGPNVSWGYRDSIAACPAGDSVVAGHPCRLRITVTYKDGNGNARVGVPPESVWVNTRVESGNVRVNDQDTTIFADDATDGSGFARIQAPSLSGNGTLRLSLFVSGTAEGSNTELVRTTDTDTSGVGSSADQTNKSDINYSGSINATDASIIATHYDWSVP